MTTFAKRWIVPLVAVLGLVTGCARLESDPPMATQHLIESAKATVDRFASIKQLAEFARHIPDAKAIVILPNLVKAGFIAGGAGGNGVLLKRGADGRWIGPAFLSLGSASFGLQAGIEQTEVILVIYSEEALQAVLKDQGSIGAGTGLTVAVYGAGIGGATTSNAGADIAAFANSKSGLFAGIQLEGAVFIRRRDLNEAFYGKGATPEAILAGKLTNPDAAPLIKALTAAANAKYPPEPKNPS